MKKSLVTFVNKHLNKINLEVYDLDNQFADGVFLCLLTGLLEGYFVPLYDFYLTPQVKYSLSQFIIDVEYSSFLLTTLVIKDQNTSAISKLRH